MSKIKLTGENSGYVEISAGQNAGNNTLETPTSGTRIVAHGGSQDVTLNSNLTVSGNVSVGGTLTYEDVTNIDAVGVITARDGIRVTSGYVGIGTDITDRQLAVYHATQGTIEIKSSDTGQSSLWFSDISDGNVGGVYYEHSNNAMGFRANDVERLRITSGGDVLVGGHSARTYDDTGDTNVILDIYGGATAGKRGVLSLSGRVGDNNGDIGTIWFNNDNNSGTSPGNQMKLSAAIQAKIVTSDGNTGSDAGAYLQFFTKPESGSLAERLRITADGKLILTPGADLGNILQLNGADTTSELLEAGITSGHVQFTATYASGGNNTCGFIFRTRDGSSGTTEKLRITSGGTLESYSPDDTTPNIKWRSNDTNWFGSLNQSVEGGTITSFLSCGGDWSANGTTYSATKALAAYPTSAIAIHNQYNSSWGSQFVFLTKAGGSTTTDGSVTERLRIDSAGRVLIGTNSGSSNITLKLQGHSGSSTQDAKIRLCRGSNSPSDGNQLGAIFFSDNSESPSADIIAIRDGGTWSGSSKPGALKFSTTADGATAATERLRITSGGKIGIGHQQEGQITKELTIRPANDGGIRFVRPGASGASVMSHLELTTTTSGSVFPSGEAYTVKYNTINNDQIFTTYEGGGTGGNISFQTGSGSGNEVERLRIDSNGELSISGSRSGNNISDAILKFNIVNSNGDSKKAEIKSIKTADTSSELIFSTTASHTFAERMRISSHGRVGINDHTGGWAEALQVSSHSSQGQYCLALKIQHNSGYFMRFNNATNICGSVSSSGGNSTSFNTSWSDSRRKKNFENWNEEVLPLFKTLEPKKFNFTDEDDRSEKTKGYVAQDVVNKFPEAYPLLDDTDVNEKRYMFNPSGMTVYLMKALQEEIAKREALEARIAALEG